MKLIFNNSKINYMKTKSHPCSIDHSQCLPVLTPQMEKLRIE